MAPTTASRPSFALQGRSKNKDAYDVVWLLECWPGGQAELANELQRSPVFHRVDFTDALKRLAFEFADIEAAGAMKYAQFMKDDDTSPDRLARHAVGAVKALLKQLDP